MDEKEEALGRLGDNWAGGFVLGHGMDIDVLREAGIEDADAVVVSTDGDNTNIVIGQVAQQRFDNQCVVVRVLDPARAEFYRQRGLRTVCPTSMAIDVLLESVRACEVRPAERATRPDVHPDRRRREGGRQLRARAAQGGQARGDADRAAGRPLRAARATSSSTRCMLGDATEIFVLERAGIARPPGRRRGAAPATTRTTSIICQLSREKYGVPKVIARVNDPRNQAHFDLLGISPTVSATRGLMALIEHEVPEHDLVHLLELRKENLEISRFSLRSSSRWTGRARAPRARSRAMIAGSRRSSARSRAGRSVLVARVVDARDHLRHAVLLLRELADDRGCPRRRR